MNVNLLNEALIFAQKTLSLTKETVFPIFCLGCDTEGEWLCPKCVARFNEVGFFACPICKKGTIFGELCVDCHSRNYLNSVIAIYNLKINPLAEKLIISWKYKYAEELVEIIGDFVKNFAISNFGLFQGFDTITAVPLHPRRLAERGFNQAEIIATALAEILELPLIDFLKRKKYTKQQAKLKKIERSKNIIDAFVAREPESIKNVLLVDDIFTTGSTMQECAKILRASGVKKVGGFVFARG